MTHLTFTSILLFKIISVVFGECEIIVEPESESYIYGTYTYNGTISECNCSDTKICVRKCCHQDYIFVNRMCVLSSLSEFKIDVYSGTTLVTDPLNFLYLPGRMICNNHTAYYRLEPTDFPDDQFYFQRDGRLWQPSVNKHIPLGMYCLEYFHDIGLSAFACFNEIDKAERKLNTLGMMISMPFLLITFIVYALFPERNIHGKSLMSYVITLCGAYFFLVIIQQHTNVVGPGCTILGTLCLFFFILSFLWMNALSIDIWWTFRGIQGFSGNKRQIEQKRFLLYCVYTWGMSGIYIIIVTIINETSPLSARYKPGIGDGQCWFTIGVPTLLYFYGPLSVIVIVNIVLFGRTAWRIKQIQQDTAILRRSENRISAEEIDKQRFYLYLKLFMAMGVNWSMEIISWAVDWCVEEVHPAVWILTDFCNAIYGVFIFLIFVFKRPTWNLLKKRYYLAVGKIQTARAIRASDSPSTSTTAITLCQRSTFK